MDDSGARVSVPGCAVRGARQHGDARFFAARLGRSSILSIRRAGGSVAGRRPDSDATATGLILSGDRQGSWQEVEVVGTGFHGVDEQFVSAVEAQDD